jgi:hypothetical protein
METAVVGEILPGLWRFEALHDERDAFVRS